MKFETEKAKTETEKTKTEKTETEETETEEAETEETETEETETETEETASEPGSPLRLYAYAGLAAGAAAAGLGVSLALKSAEAEKFHQEATSGRDKASTADDAESFALFANIAYGASAVLVAAGVTLFFLDGDGAGDVAVAPTPQGVTLHVRF